MTYSLGAYRSLVGNALGADYVVTAFDEPHLPDQALFLRHDVDYSLDMAVELAEVNADLGISATFCVLLRSQAYNLLSYPALRRLDRLRTLGQRVALHVALPSVLPPGDDALAAHIVREFELADAAAGPLEPVFAWHNVTPEALERGLTLEVPGLVNAYAGRFIREITYRSDSNMRNTVAELEATVRERHPRLHLLLHPVYWIAGGRAPLESLATAWTYVLREREEEFLQNATYQTHLPRGLSQAAVDALAAAVTAEGSS